MRLHENTGFTVHMRNGHGTATEAGCVTGSGVFDRFQSERESGDRNFAIGYYLKEKKVRLKDDDFSVFLCFIFISTYL